MKYKNDISGWVVLDKPLGLSSTQAASRIRYGLKAKKIGHVGTLDPMASGVLLIALGEATKLIPYLPAYNSLRPKVYEFDVQFGAATDTDDAEGTQIAVTDVLPTQREIKDALQDFIGRIEQMPPIYSAIKIAGKSAYSIARSGGTPDLKLRSVEIYNLELIGQVDTKTYKFKVTCGSGTYVRSIARDLAVKLGSLGHVTYLRRLQDGCFLAENAIQLEKILEKIPEIVHKSSLDVICNNTKTPVISDVIKPLEYILDDIPDVSVTENEATRIKKGQDLNLIDYQPQLDGKSLASRNLHKNPIVAIFFQGLLLAIATVEEDRIKPKRVFNWPCFEN